MIVSMSTIELSKVERVELSQRATRQAGFLDLSGGSRLDQHVVNLNLDWRPYKGLSILAAVRVEDQNTESDSTDLSTDFVSGPNKSIVASNDPESNNGTYDFLSVDESLEVRYTGLANWAFYARGEWREEQNHLSMKQVDLLTNTFLLNASTDESNLLQKYLIGAAWYPFPKLNFAAQYYHAIRQYDYSNTPDNSYPFFFNKQVFTVDDVNFRFTWRPFTSLSLVGRYDFQRSTIDTAGGDLGQVQSAVIRNHIFSGDVVWTPFGSFYLQGNVSYVIDETDTPASDALPGPVVTNFKNNYWDAGCSAGLSLDDKTDLQVQYTYYNADDYINNARFSQPYGSGAVQQSVTASISRRISNNLRLTLKYGYFTYHDITSGGHNNYNANLIYGSLQIRF